MVLLMLLVFVIAMVWAMITNKKGIDTFFAFLSVVVLTMVFPCGASQEHDLAIAQARIAHHCVVTGFSGKYSEPWYTCDDGLRRQNDLNAL